MPRADPDQAYAAIIRSLGRKPGVTREVAGASGRGGFGSTGQLKVNGHIFAMLVRGSLVVKLPRGRVEALVKSGRGERFDPRRNGRLMNEWLVVPARFEADWLALATEALAFVGG